MKTLKNNKPELAFAHTFYTNQINLYKYNGINTRFICKFRADNCIITLKFSVRSWEKNPKIKKEYNQVIDIYFVPLYVNC